MTQAKWLLNNFHIVLHNLFCDPHFPYVPYVCKGIQLPKSASYLHVFYEKMALQFIYSSHVFF